MSGAGTSLERLPVAVIGAGPVGMVAAAHLASRGSEFVVLEAGGAAGSSVRSWGHVRLFSPWKYLTDPVSRALLEPTGWSLPDGEHLPTGEELVRSFLDPLAALPALAPRLRFGRRVIGISRRGYDKVKTHGREAAPFELVVRTSAGVTERVHARAVIDASGTWMTPNPVGANGLPVEGEAELAHRIRYGIPDVLRDEQSRYAGKRTLVIGSGHSAFNAVLDLAELGDRFAGTEVVWAVRRTEPGLMFGGGNRDSLPARGSLGARLRLLVDSDRVQFLTGFHASRITENVQGVIIHSDDDRVAGPVDEVVVTTGFRPELAMLRELRVELDPWLEAPKSLSPLIDPNVHTCGTVYPHGYEELRHPEQDFFVVGMKSYGRAPTFLLLTGYEQVRSIVAALAGDMDAARDVRLVLPETGVCSTDLAESSSCCSASYGNSGPIAASCGIASGCASPAAQISAPATSSELPVAAASCCG